MEPTKRELTLDESVAQVMQTLPSVIRTYLAQGKYTSVAKTLMTKYGLRIDQAGVLEREIMLLLMGIENPDEFVKSLADEAKLDQPTINGIVKDINDQIFVPLREELRRPAGSESRPLAPATSSGQASGMRKGPTAQMAGNEPFAPRSGAPSQRSDLRSVLASVTSEVPPVKLLEDHEEPHIEFKKVPAPPPANLPGAIYHPPIVPPKPPVPIQPTPPPPPHASPEAMQGAAPPPVPLKPKPTVPASPYSSDPYREPIGEEDGR